MGSRDTGSLKAPTRTKFSVPAAGKVARYILTSAQNNTEVHAQLWDNLVAYAKHVDAQLLVGTFTYNKASLGSKGAKRKTSKESGKQDEWWVPQIEPYVLDSSVELAPGLVWCGELQILPTAEDPLSGFDSYTGRASSIIPHPKFGIRNVPSPKHSGTKFMWTTGTVTLRNYIQKKAGQKASFHHGYGAVIAEVGSDGNWYVRQLNADSEGTFYDFDVQVKDGGVTTGHRPEAIVWGDIHQHWLSKEMFDVCWGKGGILDRLRPKRQVVHDVLDFRARSHHDRDNHWLAFEKHWRGNSSVEVEVFCAAAFYEDSRREWCQTIAVASNHDEALQRWCLEGDFRADPENAFFFLEANLAAYRAILKGDDDFYVVEWAMRRAGAPEDVRFLRRDESYVVCPDAHGGIALDMHGDKGLNGKPSNIKGFARAGRKCIVAHGHGPEQFEGAYRVGVMGSLDQRYNVGMSNWAHAYALVYPNGKRTLVIVWNGKDRA